MFSLIILSLCISVHGKNVQVLDKSNFDRITSDPANSVLVNFYASACSSCEKMAPIYEKVARAFRNEKNCIVAEVDADSETELKSRHGVTGYPTIKFFSKGKKVGRKYLGGRSEKAFIKFLNKQCSTNRISDGGFNRQVGSLKPFNEIVETFMKDIDQREILITSMKEYAEMESNDKNAAKYYIKVMKKIMEKGESYIQTEISRIDKILSGHMTAEKQDEMFMRKNVLSVFREKDISKQEL